MMIEFSFRVQNNALLQPMKGQKLKVEHFPTKQCVTSVQILKLGPISFPGVIPMNVSIESP